MIALYLKWPNKAVIDTLYFETVIEMKGFVMSLDKVSKVRFTYEWEEVDGVVK